jgi:pimeloyl-ACP methyl ester carboxylesterase
MSAALPNEIIFLPGFDGVAELRAPFVAAIGARYPARGISYPNRKLGTLAGYCRYLAEQVGQDSRPILVAESFSGLVAARWAAQDPHVAGLVLCGAFAQSPVPWAALGASMPALAQFVSANFMSPASIPASDPARRQWSQAFSTAMRALDREVIAERLGLIATENVAQDLARLRIPIALMQFEEDLIIGAEARGALESVCRNARVVRFKGPHFAIEVRPRESAAALQEALSAMFVP